MNNYTYLFNNESILNLIPELRTISDRGKLIGENFTNFSFDITLPEFPNTLELINDKLKDSLLPYINESVSSIPEPILNKYLKTILNESNQLPGNTIND